MANGNYGTVRPADVSLSDIEVFLPCSVKTFVPLPGNVLYK